MARHLGGESAESYERTRREARLPGLTGGQLQAFIAVAVRAGWKVGEVRSRMFRHSYCAARLQTLDHGAPVSPYAVARELGPWRGFGLLPRGSLRCNSMRQPRFERGTFGSGGRRSIQLSYWRSLIGPST